MRDVTDQDPALTALTGTVSAVSGVLRGAGSMDLRVPHLEWTVGEVAQHLVSVVRAYTAAEQGSGPVGPDLTKVPENNARLLAATAERTPTALAGALEASTATFVATNEQLLRDQRVPYYGDLTITAAGAAGLSGTGGELHVPVIRRGVLVPFMAAPARGAARALGGRRRSCRRRR